MARAPWTQEQDQELRRLVLEGESDAEIRLALLPMRPNLTIEGVAQRRNLLGLKRKKGGARPHRAEGEQKHCLGCGDPFRSRHKLNRLCGRCRDKASGRAKAGGIAA